ncbi:hypothetical protein UO65_1052 [Actinokineospora spheciospongiae]|uniref:Uncharacterized protein n=1 Tax=Actinokineospora spheciospongiae TaxID=909613 RepID=W7ITC5_9PSEU|nr:tetratricopeptide repeat protein [Actinokineospora spheciospongiae]EWC63598.1 hypothetical protein UO65_1052 [Actinokineospora spheciospongiae]PWW65311.1 hypothetical protein DFQ13_10261 [Actinokineospora spheciospongiae]
MTDTQTLLTRARTHRDSGDQITAARLFAEAAEREPDATSILTDLALAQFHSAALTAAETTARRLVDLAPADAYAHVLLGRTLARQGRHREAVPHLRLATTMTGEWADLLHDSEARAATTA